MNRGSWIICWVFAASVSVPTAEAVLPRYQLTDVGDISGGLNESHAAAINDSGHIVGRSSNAADRDHAFFWTAGLGILDMGDFAGAPDLSRATDINNLGQVTGWGHLNGVTTAFQWTPSTGLQPIPALPGSFYGAGYSINDSGWIAGNASTVAAPEAIATIGGVGQTTASLGDLPGGLNRSFAYGINANNFIVGESAGTAGDHLATLFRAGQPAQYLGDLPGGNVYSVARNINDAGAVVGNSDLAGGRNAFVLEPGKSMVSLGDLPGGSNTSDAYSLNEAGTVVGVGTTAAGVAGFRWDATTGMTDLNALLERVSGAGYHILGAVDINERGEIAADAGFDHDNDPSTPYTFIHAVRLRPGLPGDTDFNFAVNFGDLVTLAQNYGKLSGMTWAAGDFNDDGIVSFPDLVSLAQNYNAALGTITSEAFASDWALAQSFVPEPSAVLLLTMAFNLQGRRRRSD